MPSSYKCHILSFNVQCFLVPEKMIFSCCFFFLFCFVLFFITFAHGGYFGHVTQTLRIKIIFPHRCFICNLVSVGIVVSENMPFEKIDDADANDGSWLSYKLYSNLWLSWGKGGEALRKRSMNAVCPRISVSNK